jgi:hypothetical protein
MRHALVLAGAVVATGVLAGSVTVLGLRASGNPGALEPVWTETQWPFPIDQWGRGKAFVCMPADCGIKIEVTVRPKIGYCNCATGVSDDAELERVSDADLVTAAAQPRERGNPVQVGWMYGRSRAYRKSNSEAREGLLSVAYNDECDVVVALARFGDGNADVVERAVVNFLKSTPMVLWAKKELGLEYVRREW